jgi:hypothetical protein
MSKTYTLEQYTQGIDLSEELEMHFQGQDVFVCWRAIINLATCFLKKQQEAGVSEETINAAIEEIAPVVRLLLATRVTRKSSGIIGNGGTA